MREIYSGLVHCSSFITPNQPDIDSHETSFKAANASTDDLSTTSLPDYAVFTEQYLKVLQRRLDRDMPYYLADFESRLGEAIDESHLPAYLAPRFAIAKNTLQFKVDGWMPPDNGDGYVTSGMYNAETAVVNLNPITVNAGPDELESVITHELVHALSADDVLHDPDDKDFERQGLKIGSMEPGMNSSGSRAINEGLAEYIAQALLTGNWSRVAPKIEDDVYVAERLMLAELSRTIAMSGLQSYYFASRCEGNFTEAKRNLYKEFRSNLGISYDRFKTLVGHHGSVAVREMLRGGTDMSDLHGLTRPTQSDVLNVYFDQLEGDEGLMTRQQQRKLSTLFRTIIQSGASQISTRDGLTVLPILYESEKEDFILISTPRQEYDEELQHFDGTIFINSDGIPDPVQLYRGRPSSRLDLPMVTEALRTDRLSGMAAINLKERADAYISVLDEAVELLGV